MKQQDTKKALRRLGAAGVAGAAATIGLPAAGILGASAQAATTGVPGTPSAVTVTNDGAGYATVSWKAPTTGGPAAGYNVLASGSPGGEQEYNPDNGFTLITSTSYTTYVGGTGYFEVEAINAAGDSSPSAEVSVDTVPITPGAPSGLTATATANDTVSLSWTAPAVTGGPEDSPANYTVLVGTTSGGEAAPSGPVVATVSDDGAGTTATVTGLASGDLYYFQVETTNGDGEVSAPSAEVSAATPDTPGAPTLAAIADGSSDTSVDLTWSPGPGPAPTGYDLYLGSSPGGESATPYNGTVPLTGTSLDVTGLTTGKTYYFTLKALDAAGPSPASAEVSATPTNFAPTAPTGLTATAGYTSAQLRWTAPSSSGNSPLAGYTVLAGTTSGQETAVDPADVTIDGTTATVTGLTDGTKYYFTVEANNATQTSPTSNEASATPTLTAPGAPTGLTATNPGSGTTFDLSWAAPGNLGGPTGVTYTVYEGTPGKGTALQTGLTATNYTVTGATSGSHTYYVEAVNGTGGTASSPVTISTGSTAPGAPTALAATVASSSEVDLAWDAPADQGASAVTGYTVLVGTVAGGESTTPPAGVTVTVTGTTAAVTGLNAGTGYYFTVEATNGATPDASAGSNEVSATPAAAPDAPSATATPGNGSVSLSWSAPADNGSAITGYEIFEGTTSGGESATPVKTVSGTSTSATITGLTNEQLYYFTVEAVNGVGASTASGEVSAAPAPVVPSAPLDLTTSSSGPLVHLSWTAPSHDGGSSVEGYEIYISPDVNVPPGPGDNQYGEVVGATSGTSATVDLADLYYDNQYNIDETLWFSVVAVNGVGTSPISHVVSAVVGGAEPPSQPASPLATAEVGGVKLTWSAPADNGSSIIGYLVTPYLDGTAQKTRTLGTATTATITGLSAGKTYEFTVTAQNVEGNSPASGFSNAAQVEAPSIKTAGRTGAGNVSVSGRAAPGATVTLYKASYGASRFTAAKSVKANAKGAYSLLERITSTTRLYVESDGARSSTVTAAVKDRVGLTLEAGTRSVSASVTTDPAVHGVEVRFEEVKSDGSATVLKTARITNSNGKLREKLKVAAGRVKLRAVVAAGDGATGGTSATKTAEVKR